MPPCMVRKIHHRMLFKNLFIYLHLLGVISVSECSWYGGIKIKLLICWYKNEHLQPSSELKKNLISTHIFFFK